MCVRRERKRKCPFIDLITRKASRPIWRPTGTGKPTCLIRSPGARDRLIEVHDRIWNSAQEAMSFDMYEALGGAPTRTKPWAMRAMTVGSDDRRVGLAVMTN